MKIRKGFVSNSSSSSFIVISNTGSPEKINFGFRTLIVDSELGKTKFGWENEKSSDWGSKLIFCYLQTIYAREAWSRYKEVADIWLEMLEETIKYWLDCDEIVWNLTLEYSNNDINLAYIDHASNAGDGVNIEMFQDKETLGNFIFNKDSYIQTQNDNE